MNSQSGNIMCSTGAETENETKKPASASVKKFKAIDSENEEAPKKRNAKALKKNESQSKHFKEPRRSSRGVAR